MCLSRDDEDNVFQLNISVGLMKGGGRTDSKLSYSIDYEIEKKTALMFA
jgi:hypothetical protein